MWLRQRISKAVFYLAWPVFYLYLRNTNRTRALVVYKGKVLLIKNWLSDNRYGLPGGGVRAGEQLQVAMERELAEEAGLYNSDPKFLGSEPIQELGFHFFVHLFEVKLRKKPELRRQRWEISELTWVSLDSVESVRCKPEVALALQLSRRR